jgi:hypothetical protein
MQLGTRWPFGAEPPASVPAGLRGLLATTEGAHTGGAGQHWTLTWLEGRPIAELDDGTTVRESAPETPGADVDEADDTW